VPSFAVEVSMPLSSSMRYLKVLGLVLVAVVGLVIYWRLGFSVGIPALLLIVSLAIVGPGNRLLWFLVMPVPLLLVSGAAYVLFGLLPEKPEFPRLLTLFVLVTVLPAAVLWSATKFKALRARSSRAAVGEA
jgi:hypothetical protein